MQGNKTFSVRAMKLSEVFTPRAILGVKKRLRGPVSKQFTRTTRLYGDYADANNEKACIIARKLQIYNFSGVIGTF